jgi:DNA-binding transcriptional LysR family regulator
VLAAAKEAAEQAQEAAKGERGRLLIGSSGATISFLTGVLARFRELQPRVEVTLIHMNNRALVEAAQAFRPSYVPRRRRCRRVLSVS